MIGHISAVFFPLAGILLLGANREARTLMFAGVHRRPAAHPDGCAAAGAVRRFHDLHDQIQGTQPTTEPSEITTRA